MSLLGHSLLSLDIEDTWQTSWVWSRKLFKNSNTAVTGSSQSVGSPSRQYFLPTFSIIGAAKGGRGGTKRMRLQHHLDFALHGLVCA